MTLVTVLAGVAGMLGAAASLELLEAWRRSPRRAPRTAWVRLAVPAALRRLGGGTSARAPAGLAARIEAAGIGSSASDLMALKAGAGIAAGIAAALLAPWLPGRLGLAAPVLAAAAFLGPDAWLWRRRAHRRRVMAEQLADVLDLLQVAVQAGLSPRRALGEVGRRHPGLLAAELRRTAVQLELGVSHADAVSRLEQRCPVDGIEHLVAALRRAERHGGPLGAALSAQAAEARARRARASAELAARAAPKIQLIVALLLVPSAMLLVAAAMIPALSF